MATYEEKLAAFAEGKRLLRLPRPIRNRADAFCDPCGSTLPRTLCALKDLESGRYYFAGASCLKELASLGVILRRFGKESGQAAYETEMQIRSQESQRKPNLQERQNAEREQAPTVVINGDGLPTDLPDGKNIHPAVFMIQYQDHYSAFVSIDSDGGEAQRWGYAEENRWEERWRRAGVGGLVLEKVPGERSEAARLCVVRAWVEAQSYTENTESKLNVSCGSKDSSGDISRDLPGSMLALLQLADLTKIESHHVPVDGVAKLAERTTEAGLWKR